MIGLRTAGFSELAQALRALPSELTKSVLTEALFAAGEPMRARMASLMTRGDEAPHAADNVVMSALKSFEGVKVGEREAAIGIGPSGPFFYWYFVEYGTSRHPAQPAMRPAFDSDAERALTRLGTEIWKVLKSGRSSGATTGRGL